MPRSRSVSATTSLPNCGAAGNSPAGRSFQSSAAVIRGRRALGWLTRLGLPSRLVDATGAVLTVAGWPDDSEKTV